MSEYMLFTLDHFGVELVFLFSINNLLCINYNLKMQLTLKSVVEVVCNFNWIEMKKHGGMLSTWAFLT